MGPSLLKPPVIVFYHAAVRVSHAYSCAHQAEPARFQGCLCLSVTSSANGTGTAGVCSHSQLGLCEPWDLNSGTHACVASAALTESHLNKQIICYSKYPNLFY